MRFRRTLRLSGSPTQFNKEARSWRVRSKRVFGGLVEFSIAKGTWSRNSDNTITTKTRFCVAPMGFDASDGATDERQWKIGHEGPNRVVLVHKDESITPLPDDFRDIDGLAYMLRFAAKCE